MTKPTYTTNPAASQLRASYPPVEWEEPHTASVADAQAEDDSDAEDGLSGQGSPRSLAQAATQETPAPAEATLRRDSQRALPPTVDRPVSRGGPKS